MTPTPKLSQGEKFAVNDLVSFKGTKSRGDSWNKFISNFKPRTKDDLYGIVFTVHGKDIWVYVCERSTVEMLDKSTWGFLECDLELDQ